MIYKQTTVIGYSLALLDIANDEKKIKEFYDQSIIISTVLNDSEDLERVLDNLSIDIDVKMKIIDKSFKDFHWAFINTIKILILQNKFKIFKNIINNLIKQLQEILNIKEGTIYSTYPLNSKEINKLEKKLSEDFNTKIKLKNLIDKELIGGYKIHLGSTVIENSIKSKLNLISKSLIKQMKKGGV